ncbi:uncharacterized protein K460DRAFT_351831 [Cucurbitaria berberidis CBS 394.84]|uniref:Genetic interactor of prohibitins 3, mitochondrial n=1 Tax=Cucurbitaria berberidis CBS 394.84 TaxID=1168544 RepID=A0A9P4LEF0_9PLEO|nr:uncharacterized protein K460DRAFT_351831 [Cucurbitaria berberidis CBS 394.84]KAF1851975.1 hypothetical protein K460DRAFT_351831 [Cucurbitaria berberidis CBS 394.84]
MRPAFRQARTLLNYDAHASIPAFLCPVLLRAPVPTPHRSTKPTQASHKFSTSGRAQHSATATLHSADAIESLPLNAHSANTPPTRRSLPRACPGCGAPTQIYDKREAGYYNIDRKVIREYLEWDPNTVQAATKEDDIYSKALQQASPELLKELRIEEHAAEVPDEDQSPQTPVCDRCHKLVHHHVGTPIHHPTVESIQQTIAESPHRRNHIYHVVDAADFPLSIIPNLQSSLRIPKLRTQNRRAKHKGWVANDRIAEVSFIITRADLLAPKKEQVDVLMPYFTEVLRDALGRTNNKARLGNVRLVSAKRGWWTKQVKEDIWDRGGAGWMVGKVNVGKSNLFEAVFPKGRGADYQDVRRIRSTTEREAMLTNAKSLDELTQVQQQLAEEDAETERLKNKPQQHLHQPPKELKEEELDEEDFEDPDALLPPPQPYTPYPVLPIASSLPGTTASPIRIPFGRNRGELVDLPGLARTNPGLETFVQPDEHDDLVMKNRINSERYTLKPGQSLILGGGLIRITPKTEDLVFLVHPFVPIHPHVTRTEKAIDYQNQTSERQLQHPSILAPNVGDKMNSAGKFQLKWDVTKKLAGPMTSAVAGKMKPENLPFRIWSTDILIEGVGWVEISAQTRRPQGWKPVGMSKKDPNHAQHERRASLRQLDEYKDRKFATIARAESAGEDPQDALSAEFYKEDMGDRMASWEDDYPEVEVFSPLGKFVGQRRPMCASTVSGPKQIASRDRKARPRRSMVSVKRQRKPGGGGE